MNIDTALEIIRKEKLTKYYNYPKLENVISQAEFDSIVQQATSSDAGSATMTLICKEANCVYYLTQCPAKFIMSQIYDQWRDVCCPIEPIGNYDGQFNIYKAPLLIGVDSYEDYDTFCKQLPSYILEYIDNYLVADEYEPYHNFTQKVIRLVEYLGFSAREDVRGYNIMHDENGKYVLTDPVWVRTG